MASTIHSPKKPKTHARLKSLLSSTLACGGCASRRLKLPDVHHPLPDRPPRLVETLAVIKDSDDPYLDFKQSMLQIMFDKDIFARPDLQELLACFLRLNSPAHHGAIIRAFSDIWKAVMSPPPEFPNQDGS